MNKIGLVLDNFYDTDSNVNLVRQANSAIMAHKNTDIIGFYKETPEKVFLDCDFSLMPLAELWGYNGIVIVDSIIFFIILPIRIGKVSN